jgi:hypothetical protein
MNYRLITARSRPRDPGDKCCSSKPRGSLVLAFCVNYSPNFLLAHIADTLHIIANRCMPQEVHEPSAEWLIARGGRD